MMTLHLVNGRDPNGRRFSMVFVALAIGAFRLSMSPLPSTHGVGSDSQSGASPHLVVPAQVGSPPVGSKQRSAGLQDRGVDPI